jgi:hypothetical protein
MIWLLIGGFWVGFLCGMFTMCMFVTRNRPSLDRVTEESESPPGDPPTISVTSPT